MLERSTRFPASPNRHCMPTPPLPPSPRTATVHPSTHPMLRLPPHTTVEKQLRKAMFGTRPSDGWDGEMRSTIHARIPKITKLKNEDY